MQEEICCQEVVLQGQQARLVSVRPGSVLPDCLIRCSFLIPQQTRMTNAHNNNNNNNADDDAVQIKLAVGQFLEE